MSEYELELFREKGFSRKKCTLCGKHFWSVGERKTCGEPPCEEYSFIGDSPTKKSMDLSEMRELYLSFFEKRGHSRIPRYPIIARWRDDIFFTIASISCFQPWVLNGTIDPPANPLVMSQTCVRFNDIDNVGKTGRHLTEFEMMAHHAFNKKGKEIYFKDRTVGLCHELLLSLGIPEDEVQYLEADWAGGGNSGPCFEVIVRGVELATLVFMMYRDTPSGKEKMDMQVVDTGYGLERFVWISQGTANAYEAIFGDVLARLKKETSIHSDEKIIAEYSKLAGMMNIESNADLKVLRKRVAERMKVPVDKIIEAITPLEHLYSVCDHTRSLMFMLSDGGIVPSNVKAGYFARLLARKSLRSMKALGLSMPLSEILGMQVDYFKGDFPELAENKDDLLGLINVEEEKYAKTLVRGRSIVFRLDAEARKDGKDRIDLPSLIDLYDSQGLTPEIVTEFSSLKVDVPDDFYIKVAAKHEKPQDEEEKAEELNVPKVAATVLGYYEDAYVKEFSARVIKKFDDFIILDKTYFYPEGGGQDTDLGVIGPLEVLDVQKSGSIVIHRVKGDIGKVKENDLVSCKVNWGRRLQLMQHHTGTHIINGAARRVLGNHAWQAGAHKSEELGRLDLTHHSAISDEEKNEIERLANEAIKEKRDVKISFLGRDIAEKTHGFRIYQGGAVPGKVLRIVDIAGWDVEACGGMHFRNTSEVGGIRLTDSKRIQDGVVRLEFKAGKALSGHEAGRKELAGKVGGGLSENELSLVASVFSVQVEQLPKTVERFRSEWTQQRDELRRFDAMLAKITDGKEEASSKYSDLPSGDSVSAYRRLFEEWKTQKKDIDSVRARLQESLAEKLRMRLASDYLDMKGIKVVKEIVSGLDVKNVIELAKAAVEPNSLLIVANKIDNKANIVVCSKSAIRADETAKKLCARLGGGAHGNGELAVGGGSSEGIESVLEELVL
jgi:alanyl-tRNA synthetase